MTRTHAFAIFIPMVLTIYGSVNAYIFIRGLQTVPQSSALRPWFIAVFWVVALSYIAARFLERFAPPWATEGLIWIGSFWLGAMAYFFIILVVIDCARLVNYFLPFFPGFINRNLQYAKQITALAVTGIVLLVLIGGRINQAFPRVRTIEIAIHKKSPIKELNVALATDIHLGTIVCNSHFMRIVDKINSVHPDIVLFAGDIVDEDIAPVIRQNLGDTIQLIHSKYGTYGITGNHEYIGGVETACVYLEAHGVTMLRDRSVKIDNAFTLVGREDRSLERMSGAHRKDLHALMKDVDGSLPVILMDHQPFGLDDAVKNNIDLQFSGHTHDGQLWPFNFITNRIYELSYGYMQKGNTQFYVSCGVGTWGPPIRTSGRPEVVNIRLKFD